MKSKLFVLLTLLVLVSIALSSCAPAPAPTKAPEKPAEQKPAEPTKAAEKPVEPTKAPEKPAEPTKAPEKPAEPTKAPEKPAEAKFFWSVPLKQAIAAAIDREALVDRVFEGRNIPAYHMVPPGYPYATEPFRDKYGTRDLEMAKKLLSGLGYTAEKPFTFELFYPPEHYGTTTADVMQVLKAQIEETGLAKVELKSQEWAEYSKSYRAHKFPFFMLGWFPDFVDPETWLSPFGTCEQSPGLGVFYCNKKMDELLLKAGSSADPKVREAAYKEAGILWAEEVPVLPMFWEPEFVTARKGVEGIKIGPPFEFNYNILSFTKDAKPASGKMDTIIIGTTDKIQSLDANDAYATHDWEMLKNTGVALLSYEPGTANLIPGAADLPKISEDGKTYTFTLKKGIKFADGTPLTAKDYVRAWKRLSTLSGDVGGLITAYVADTQAADDMTVVYTLKASFAFFPALAASAPFVPVNPKIFPDDKLNKYPEKLDGIGPYRLVSLKQGEQAVLEANPNYSGEGKPKIKTVIIKYFADPATMSAAIEKGEIDIAWRILGAVEATRLQKDEKLKDVLAVTKVDAPSLRYLIFDHQYPAK